MTVYALFGTVAENSSSRLASLTLGLIMAQRHELSIRIDPDASRRP
jgi:hypothetical protein